MRYPALAASPHPPWDASSFAPPEVNIINNMMIARFHHGPSALTYIWFYHQVKNHGPWDYKNQSGKQYANFGNFHYGAVGHAAGIADEVLLRAAGAAQILAGTSSPAFSVDLTLYIQTSFLSYGCDNFLRIYSRGERYPSALCG